MGTLIRIANALESIAGYLQILVVNTYKEASIQQMGKDDVQGKGKEDLRKKCSENAQQPRWSIQEVNILKKMLDNKFRYADIASTLNRTLYAVQTKAYKMGWCKYSRGGSKDHDELLLTKEEILKSL